MKNCTRETVEGVIAFHSTSILRGLPPSDVLRLREVHGLNKLEAEEKDPIWWRFLEQFKDPLILMLLASAALSILVGQHSDAMSILGAVAIVGSVAFYQEYQSEQSLEALSTLVPPRCNCLRNGATVNILAEEVVPGDIIRLQAGDRVPADCRVLESVAFAIDESTLTGEAEPRQKNCAPLHAVHDESPISDKTNIAFMGTLVTTGNACVIALSTGSNTEFGKTFEEMKEIEDKKTPLQDKMDDLGKQLSIFSFGLISVVVIIGVVQGQTFLAMFNIGVALAVAAIPEGLPICVTVTLALGVMRMAHKNAIVKKLPAVEALGCANYICCDKTGTLTQNKMTVMQIYTPSLLDTVELRGVSNVSSSTRTNSDADQFANPTSGSEEKSPLLTNDLNSSAIAASGSQSSSAQAFYENKAIDVHTIPPIQELFDAACLCNNAYLAACGTSVVGQPTEGALLLAASRLGLVDRRSTLKRVSEQPFSSETKFMECRYSSTDGGNVSAVKGALEMVLPQCVTYIDQDGSLQLLSTEHKHRIDKASSDMASTGLRVIAIAKGGKDARQNQFSFCGLLGLMDPLRTGVPAAVARIQQSGAKVMMITGDAMTTAVSISTLAGIYVPDANADADADVSNTSANPRLASGHEIEEAAKAGDDVLARLLEDVSVCYRTSPRHKLSIVRALQSVGHVVAMTGDGVNDAPALKKADIGVAVGSGTDVAKEAAHMVILDDDFSTIVGAIEEGKSIYFNIKNFLTFQLSTSVAALSLVCIMNIFGKPNPLNPMQILWINIIMDGPLAQSLGVEPVDTAVMARPPRTRSENILTRPLIMRVLTSGLLILLGTMFTFVSELDADTGEATSRTLTMTFTTFVMFDMFNAVSCRNNNKPVFDLVWNSNKAFLLSLSFSLVGQMLVVYFPPLQSVFRTESLSARDMGYIFSLTSSMLVLDTVRKNVFPHIFTELLPTVPGGAGGEGGAGVGGDGPQPARKEFSTYRYGLQDKVQSLLGGWSPVGLVGGQLKKKDSEGESGSKV